MTNAPEHEHRDPVDPPPAEEAPAGSRRSAGGARRKSRDERQLPIWQEMILLLGIAMVLAIVIKAFFMQAFYIPSGSMNDTLVLNDRILVQKVSYWSGEPERGDIVVFSDPGGWLNATEVRSATNPVTRGLELFGLFPTGGHLVKRVIGVGGDTVKCCDKQGRITVNGVPLNERSYLAKGEKPSMIEFEVDVQDGYLWVQGDNRSNSADSRVHLGDPGGGQIPVDDVVGKVFLVVWPWDHFELTERPATFDAVSAD
ncbi:MAG TPA: signal peptidase I [Nocardioidaceae bacterium]|nr:signal peptidase I [Nocardioidaceae bacterium]